MKSHGLLPGYMLQLKYRVLRWNDRCGVAVAKEAR